MPRNSPFGEPPERFWNEYTRITPLNVEPRAKGSMVGECGDILLQIIESKDDTPSEPIEYICHLGWGHTGRHSDGTMVWDNAGDNVLMKPFGSRLGAVRSDKMPCIECGLCDFSVRGNDEVSNRLAFESHICVSATEKESRLGLGFIILVIVISILTGSLVGVLTGFVLGL